MDPVKACKFYNEIDTICFIYYFDKVRYNSSYNQISNRKNAS